MNPNRVCLDQAFLRWRGKFASFEATCFPGLCDFVRVHFDEKGEPKEFVPFVSGWLLTETTQFGRPCGLAVAKDGSLIVGDDTLGWIYRVTYSGPH